MEPINRRSLLEAIVETSESDQARLKALELLDRLDERERQEGVPERPDFAGQLADDPERLSRVIELADEYLFADLPAYQERVERRAQEIVEEQAGQRRAAFEVVGSP